MLPENRIPVWTHWRRRHFLNRFRGGLQAYFDAVTYEAFPFRIIETEKAKADRSLLEPDLERCRATLRAAGIRLARSVPEGHQGGMKRINLVTEAFALDQYSLRRDDLLAVCDAGIRAYDAGRTAAWVRTLNPLYWLDMVLSVVEVLPFLPLRAFGRNPVEVAMSARGRAVRVLLRGAALAGLLILLVVGLGFQERVLVLGEDAFAWISGVLSERWNP